jgi:hypothetical protein
MDMCGLSLESYEDAKYEADTYHNEMPEANLS